MIQCKEQKVARATVTAVVFTYNSAGPTLKRVLEAIQWADEIIVVDMESKDNTAQVCLEYTEKFLTHNENENINANFNFGYQQATSDYILHIESDYVVPPELKREILDVLSNDQRSDIYEIGITNYYFGKPVRLSVWEKIRLPRLFKKGTVSYPTYRIETWPKLLSQNKRSLKNRIDHYTVEHIWELVRKYNRYSDIEVRNSPNEIPLVHNPLLLGFSALGCTLYNYLFRGGFRYGMHGFIVS
ncbi:MAG: hypothetical protein A3J39_02545, partial [Sulfuricurvum sp. RIFCSPHIGHO2_12_FULL_44_8]